MWRRGADLEGHVANFVETEQVLDAEGYTASYVQARTSSINQYPQQAATFKQLCLNLTLHSMCIFLDIVV